MRYFLDRLYVTTRTRIVLGTVAVVVAGVLVGVLCYQPVDHSWVVPTTLPVLRTAQPPALETGAAADCVQSVNAATPYNQGAPSVGYASVRNGTTTAVFVTVAKERLFAVTIPSQWVDRTLAVPAVCESGRPNVVHLPMQTATMSLVTPVQAVVTRLSNGSFAVAGIASADVRDVVVKLQHGRQISSSHAVLHGTYFALVVAPGVQVTLEARGAGGRVLGLSGGVLTTTSKDTVWG